MDTRRRSWAKSAIWRVIGILILGGISYGVTRDLGAVTFITLVFHGLRLVLYYWHERLWERIAWGKIRHPLESFCMNEALTTADIVEIKVLLEERGYVAKAPEYEI